MEAKTSEIPTIAFEILAILALLITLVLCTIFVKHPHWDSRIGEWIFLLVESGIREFIFLGFEIRNSAQGIRAPANDWNPEPILR